MRSSVATTLSALSALLTIAACGASHDGRSSVRGNGTPVAIASDAPLSGVYRWTLTKDDARLHGTVNDKTPEGLAGYPSTFTLTLKDGGWSMRQTGSTETGEGSFTVTGDRVEFTWPRENLTLTFTFAANGHRDLRLKPVPPMDVGDQFVWSTWPWTKIG